MVVRKDFDMNRKSFEWLQADINCKMAAFRKLEEIDVLVFSALGKSAYKVYAVLQQTIAVAENKADFRDKVEKKIICAKSGGRLGYQEYFFNADEICLLEYYLTDNFNAVKDAPEEIEE